MGLFDLYSSEDEEWKQIVGYPNYYVSNMGRIKSIATGKLIILKLHICLFGYYRISISTNNKRKCFKIHRLVAEAFIGNPDNKPMVNHIDGDKLNNFPSNLEWVNTRENMDHAMKHGLIAHGEKNFWSKLTSRDVNEIANRYLSGGITMRALASEYNVVHGTINRIINGDGWEREKIGLLKNKLDAYHGVI